jgi:Kdo2-lipid IVA lauroyltransferase/acyltransferase
VTDRRLPPLAPWHWPAWLLVGLIRLLSLLPYPALLVLGRGLGRLLFRTIKRWRFYTVYNLGRCFPELDERAVDALARRHFEALGIGVFEVALAWWASDARTRALLVDVAGLENLERARAGGRGVILFTGHFTPLDFGGRLVRQFVPLDILYRPSANPVLEYLVQRRRLAHAAAIIHSTSARDMIRRLRQGACVWYAPDEAYTRKESAMVGFFGHPAPTNTATPRIARAGRAAVVPYYPERLAGGGYRLHFLPALEDFPGDDPIADTARTNRVLEDMIRRVPEQYVWVLDRFRSRIHRR